MPRPLTNNINLYWSLYTVASLGILTKLYIAYDSAILMSQSTMPVNSDLFWIEQLSGCNYDCFLYQ